MVRRLRSCASCRRRYASASGAIYCPSCRDKPCNQLPVVDFGGPAVVSASIAHDSSSTPKTSEVLVPKESGLSSNDKCGQLLEYGQRNMLMNANGKEVHAKSEFSISNVGADTKIIDTGTTRQIQTLGHETQAEAKCSFVDIANRVFPTSVDLNINTSSSTTTQPVEEENLPKIIARQKQSDNSEHSHYGGNEAECDTVAANRSIDKASSENGSDVEEETLDKAAFKRARFSSRNTANEESLISKTDMTESNGSIMNTDQTFTKPQKEDKLRSLGVNILESPKEENCGVICIDDDTDDDEHPSELIDLEQTSKVPLDQTYEETHQGPSSHVLPACIPKHGVGSKSTECFICGSSFTRISTGMRGRLNHIKRCAKKNGMTARDIKLNDDEEDFTVEGSTLKSPNIEPCTASGTTTQVEIRQKEKEASGETRNPYSKKDWHGDANVDLALAEHESNCNSDDDEKPVVSSKHTANTAQPKMTSFFKAPIKSLNNVLLAGAKRLAKTADIAEAKLKDTSSKTAGAFAKRKRRDFSKLSCPSYKRITGTDFICDGFLYARSTLSSNYFLTHFHSDHYGGITSKWCAGIIYCSLPTANLVHQQLGVDKRYLHPLGMMTPTVIESRGSAVTVTLLDANHCPGSIMFLFEVGKRKILHVGDFRWDREVMLKQSPIQAFVTGRDVLDELFFDTTYCNEKYSLPTQQEAIHATIDAVEKELLLAKKRGTKTLFLFGSYTIGKERIYLSVAERFGMKVFVDTRRYRILSALTWPKKRMEIFTTNKAEACIWVVPLGHVNFKHIKSYLDDSNEKIFTKQYNHVVGFRPTGWTHTPGNQLISSRTNGKFTVNGVPYSEHSSFPELVDCITCLRPKRIIPTVSVSKSEEQIGLLLNAARKRQSDPIL